jgi:hypothetical protein
LGREAGSGAFVTANQSFAWRYYLRESRRLSRRLSRWAADARAQARRSPAAEKSRLRKTARADDARADRQTATARYLALVASTGETGGAHHWTVRA